MSVLHEVFWAPTKSIFSPAAFQSRDTVGVISRSPLGPDAKPARYRAGPPPRKRPFVYATLSVHPSIRTPPWTFLPKMAAQRVGNAAQDEGVNAATAQAALGAIADAPNSEEVDEGTPLIPVEKLKVM